MLTRGYGDVDLSAPIDWRHPDNAGLALRLLGLPGVSGGPRWPDLTGNTAGATLAGGAAWTPTQWGQAGVSLSGSGQYLDTPASCGPAGTIAVTVQPAFGPDTSARYVFDSFGSRTLLYQNIQAVGSYGLYVNGTTVSDTPTGLVLSLPQGVPTRLVVAWGGGSVQVYRGGTLFASFAVSVGASSGQLRFGSRFNGQDFWAGQQFGQLVRAVKADAGWAARDYERARDLSRDDTLRRLTTRAYLLPSAAPAAGDFVPAFAPGWGY